MTRRMSAKRRMEVWIAHGGVCHICGLKIDGGKEKWHVEHKNAHGISGDDSDANLAPAHVSCHAVKTKADIKAIAKAKRMEQRAVGINRQSRGGFRSWRKFDGTIVKRGD
jgi:5-methylcytosine-specific restriction endonuclease McrA